MEQTNTISEAKAASSTIRDRLMDDLQHTIDEAEKWLEDSAGETLGNGSSEARTRFDDTLRTARSDLRKLEDSLLDRGRSTADSVNVYVRDNPWKAVGIGATLGIIAGMLLSRK